MRDINHILLIVFFGLLAYIIVIEGSALAERTYNKIQTDDAISFQQSAIDSARGAGNDYK